MSSPPLRRFSRRLLAFVINTRVGAEGELMASPDFRKAGGVGNSMEEDEKANVSSTYPEWSMPKSSILFITHARYFI